MKTRLSMAKPAVLALWLASLVSLSSVQAEPVEDPAHFDELAALVQARANSLCWEMHRYHRQQPDFGETYRMAKEVWALGGSLRDLLRTGPVDNATVAQQAQRIGEIFDQVERRASRWEGVAPIDPAGVPVEERGVVAVPRAGLDIDVPFFGLRLGTPGGVVVREDMRLRFADRRRPHVNARGSTRSLQRELDSAKIAVSYLMEDAGVGNATVPGSVAPQAVPQGPPQPAPSVGPVLKITPPTKNATTANNP